MEEIKVLYEAKKTIESMKKLYVGDPDYFEEFEGEKLDRLVYFKNFRNRKNWSLNASISECDGELLFTVCLAPNEKLVNIYRKKYILETQKQVSKDIGVDCACYIIGFNNKEIEVKTMSDGYCGEVIEIYNKSDKLEGIIIELSAGDYDDSNFRHLKGHLEYLFDTKF